jgi:uncharacterized protein YkwD
MILVALGALVALLMAVLAASSLPGAGPETASAATRGTDCPHGGSTRDEATRRQIRRAVICLINRRRDNRGSDPLQPKATLRNTSQEHAQLMVEEDCFEHRCPGEDGLAKRIRDSGYLRGAENWRYAESLGCAQTPRAMVHLWLQERFDRRNILGRGYEDIGLGVVKGAPRTAARACRPANDFVTFTLLVARRRP